MTVALTFQVMPSSVQEDLEKIKTEIRKIQDEANGIKVVEIREQPIAFGIIALIVLITVRDASNDIEQKISAIKGVENVEAQGATIV